MSKTQSLQPVFSFAIIRLLYKLGKAESKTGCFQSMTSHNFAKLPNWQYSQNWQILQNRQISKNYQNGQIVQNTLTSCLDLAK